ncbi:MAG: transglycosylase SLT domain-containing protein [Paracoccaceae bacterium]
MPRLKRLRGALSASTLVIMAACGGGDRAEAPPKNQNDICAIFDQRPGWEDAMIASSNRWGAPVPVQMAIMWRESSFRSSVRPPGRVSSAYGFAQAIDGTWDWYREDTGNSSADRTDFEDAADFIGWYMSKSRSANNIPMYDAYNQYLAYHEGHAGHRRGSYNAKEWLPPVADRVADQAARYARQLPGC